MENNFEVTFNAKARIKEGRITFTISEMTCTETGKVGTIEGNYTFPEPTIKESMIRIANTVRNKVSNYEQY